MKVLVCGGRDFRDKSRVFSTLNGIHSGSRGPIFRIVHGGSRGADTLAHHWATQNEIPIGLYMAEWGKYGRSAGPIRNCTMLETETPDLVVAFSGGIGTENMVSQALSAGVEVIRA